MNNYKIFGVMLLTSIFTINQAMEQSIKTEGKKEVSNLVRLSVLPVARDIVKFYDNEFINDPGNAFQAMQNYVNSKNIPGDLINNIYCQIVTELKRSDIFIRELFSENQHENTNLSPFFSLCYDAKYGLVANLTDILMAKNKYFTYNDLEYADNNFESAEALIFKILKNYHDVNFDNDILIMSQDALASMSPKYNTVHAIYTFNLSNVVASQVIENIIKMIEDRNRIVSNK